MKEAEIRPQELFNRYLEVVRQDIKMFFADKSQFVDVECPACGCNCQEFAFEKLGFQYKICKECGSLYLSPRPTSKVIDHYYQEGKAVKFWSSNFYRETSDARRKKIYRPRAELVADILRSYSKTNNEVFTDVGAGFGIFLEEVSKQDVFQSVIGVEPAPNMADICRSKGFQVVEKPIEAVLTEDVQANLVTSFEVLEHVFSPCDFLKAINKIIVENGLILFTTLTISGFDLQVLWEHSKSIYPPHHINLISFEGMHRLVERSGYEVIQITTPGKIDLDIVVNAVREDPAIKVPRFVRHLIEKTDTKAQKAFQIFLQENNLSSHIRCIARKK